MLRRSVIAAAVLAIALAGCGRRRASPPTPPPPSSLEGSVSVAVSDDLRAIYDAAQERFRETQPRVEVSVASGPASADVSMAIGGDGAEFARVPLILIVPKGNPKDIRGLGELAATTIESIAIADLQAGADVRDALKSVGILSACEPKLRQADGPDEAAALVAAGEADIAILPATYLAGRKLGADKSRPAKGTELLGAVPEADFAGLSCRVKGLTESADAAAFAQFLTSSEGQKIVRKAGLAATAAEPEGTTLHIYCGTGLRPPMDELAELYTRETGVQVDVSYAGSGCLLSQLTFAQRGDLYMPGEVFYINQAKERGYIVEFKQVAWMAPVIMVQKGNPKGISSLQDLAKPGLKIGLGEAEAAAIGRATNDLLDRAGLREEVERNCVMRGVNIAELGNVVKLKAVDAVIIWNANALLWADSTDSIPIPREYYDPAEICMGLLTFSEHESAARRLLKLAASERGRAIFEKHGYVIPEGAAGEDA